MRLNVHSWSRRQKRATADVSLGPPGLGQCFVRLDDRDAVHAELLGEFTRRWQPPARFEGLLFDGSDDAVADLDIQRHR